jgi:chaperonin cofactor prefoldin
MMVEDYKQQLHETMQEVKKAGEKLFDRDKHKATKSLVDSLEAWKQQLDVMKDDLDKQAERLG